MARKLPEFVTREDFDKLLDQANKEREKYWMPRKKKYKKVGQRIEQFIIAMCLGYGGGLRISEVFGLKAKKKYLKHTKKMKEDKLPPESTSYEINISPLTSENIDERFIRIKSGKGKKDRVVPYPTSILRRAGITKAQLFKYLPLTVSYRSCENWITALGRRVLHKHITFHQLRHGFITALMNSGMPVHQVQIYSGHSRLDTLGIYAHANPEQGLSKYNEAFR